MWRIPPVMLLLLATSVLAAEEKGLPKVLIIGDSISMGYTQPAKELLAGKANVERPAENCRDTALGLEKLADWLGDKKWDVIHFNWGLHDIKLDLSGQQAVTIERYTRNMEDLAKRLKATGAKLIWASTTPVPEGASGRLTGDEVRYNQAAAAIMKRNGIPIDDLYDKVKPLLAKYQQPQNVHFTPEGSKFLAEQVAAEILKVLDRKPD